MKMISLKCTECGAALKIEEDRELCYCQYCGTKIILDDEAITHKYKDEARIKEAEVSEKIRLKELELKEQKIIQKAKQNRLLILLSVVGLFLFIVGNMIGDIFDSFYSVAAGGIVLAIGAVFVLLFTYFI